MPLYEYRCESCGHQFEAIQQKFSDPPPEKCPRCDGVVRKLQSAPAIQFKGSGFYITDYAKKDSSGPSTEASKDAKADAKAEGGEKKTDTAPAASGNKATAKD